MTKQLFLVFAFCCNGGFISCAQVPGCTDPLAANYNGNATWNDGSCTYNAAAVTPLNPLVLSDTLMETSGLLWWDNRLWTHNDNTDNRLHAIDTNSGQSALAKQILAGNYDWEEIAQDDDFVYIGDFGNNGNGNRQDLHILRVSKAALATGSPVQPDTITFHYQDQTDFTGTGANNTDFDCEAFIAGSDSLFLFTKQWISKKTTVYALPKQPGNYTAVKKQTFAVQGLITGAHYQPARKTIVLLGYSLQGSLLIPFVYLLYDFQGTDFFSGNKRKLDIPQPMHQVEGITSRDGNWFYITNEKISVSMFNISPKLQRLNLSPFLAPYYQSLSVRGVALTNESVSVYPNPTRGNLAVNIHALKPFKSQISLYDSNRKAILSQEHKLVKGTNKVLLQLPELANGQYTLQISGPGADITKKIIYLKD